MKNSAVSWVRNGARRLRDNTAGLALIEFALVLPALSLLCLGGLELSSLAMAYLKVNSIAIKTADNAARVRTSIDEADINEIFTGAKLMGENIDFASRGRIILSSIEPLMNTASPPQVVNQYLRWQRCTGANAANSSHGSQGDGATGTAYATGYGLTGKPKITAAKNTTIMLAEVVYDYKPLFTFSWYGPITMRVAQSITVRERSDQIVKNASSLAAANQSLCTNPHAA
jgi:Flp pilus assembly protein TadG